MATFSLPAHAAPHLASVFSDHMVVQRNKPIAVWGWADPGERVRVQLASGDEASTQADSHGRWRVALQPLAAGGPYTLRVTGTSTVLVRDVMVGEVWVLSGQSNMSFALSRASNAASAIPEADRPFIRLLTVPKNSSLQAVDSFKAEWQVCTPESAQDFSAVAYFFGSALEKELHVPIGLVHTSWPGTSGEEWTDPASLAADPILTPIVDHWHNVPDSAHVFAGPGFPFDLSFRDFVLLKHTAAGEQRVPFTDPSQPTTKNSLGGQWSYTWDTAPGSTFEMRNSGHPFEDHLAGRLHPQDIATLRAAVAPHNNTGDLSTYSGLEFSVRGSGFFQLQVAQPSIKDEANYSSDILSATPEWHTVRIHFADLKQPSWGVQVPWTPAAINSLALVIRESNAEYSMRPPSGLYNGMIAPLVPFSIRGFVWYQGEGNAGRAYQYRKLLPALIEGWRKAWDAPSLPFLIVQLPNHGDRKPEPSESAWAEMREAQLQATRLQHTGIAVTIDVGEANNVHPADKVDVGNRLARLALGTIYAQHIAFSGPLFESAHVEHGRMRVHFRNTFGGLKTTDGRAPIGFAVAGADHRFVWANAKIEGDDVVLSSPDVANPVAVRYAWADNPEQNLTNASGIPASPFRSDDWPGVTFNAR